MELGGWGRYPTAEVTSHAPRAASHAVQLIRDGFRGIARGLGRSYGDSSLAPRVLETRYLDHILELDPAGGTVRCEAGVGFDALLRAIVPRGFFLPVVPGTRFVTVGGAIASDIHGKNHHAAGSFCQHVHALTLLLASGEIVSCSRHERPELFRASCGGMGLTGLILDATFALKAISSSAIRETVIKAANLEEIFALFKTHRDSTYSVAWIDCLATGDALGRSLLLLGEHAEEGGLAAPRKRAFPVPCNAPRFLIQRAAMRAFNALYYHRIRRDRLERERHYQGYFFPLDALAHWNRLYGRRGFLQYQLAVPHAAAGPCIRDVVGRVARSGRAAALGVLKVFGPGSDHYLSFPIEGYTLAMDFPWDAGLLAFLEELDAVVHDAGGRLYLSKDARMSGEALRRGYPQLDAFATVRERCGASGVFDSLQSRRLGL